MWGEIIRRANRLRETVMELNSQILALESNVKRLKKVLDIQDEDDKGESK